MRKISDTITRLTALHARGRAASHDLHGEPERLSTLSGFGSNPGALTAKYYLPEDLPNGAPLVVVVHGCTQTAAGYHHHSGWSRLADEAGIALLYPEQQRGNNANLCFNWFQPFDVRRDEGEAHSIRQMIEAMVIEHGLDRERIFITGLSAGGAMAAAMLASYPDVFAGGAIIAGLAYGSATTVPQAFDRMRGHGGPTDEAMRRTLRDASSHRGPWPRISIWQGTGDRTVDASNAEAIASQWWGVHQIEGLPDSLNDGANARRTWRDGAGQAVLEINLIDGMGHGTPVDRDGYGRPGPYMLDVGICSTRDIARFWGIEQGDTREPARSNRKMHTQVAAAPQSKLGSPAKSSPPAATSTTPASGVQKIIEDALRAAGLMR